MAHSHVADIRQRPMRRLEVILPSKKNLLARAESLNASFVFAALALLCGVECSVPDQFVWPSSRSSVVDSQPMSSLKGDGESRTNLLMYFPDSHWLCRRFGWESTVKGFHWDASSTASTALWRQDVSTHGAEAWHRPTLPIIRQWVLTSMDWITIKDHYFHCDIVISDNDYISMTLLMFINLKDF